MGGREGTNTEYLYEYRNRNRNRNEEGQKSSYGDRNRVSVMTSFLFPSLSLRGIFVV